MPTEALTCPTCGANDSSRADANGLHTCVYCGVRYRMTGGHPTKLTTTPPTTAPPKAQVAVAVGAAVALVAIGAVVFVTTAKGPPPPLSDRAAAQPNVVIATSPPVIVEAPGDVPSPAIATAEPVIVEAPEPEAPARAHFEMHYRRPSSGATFYATGRVINDSPYVIDRPKITAVLKDAAGAEVGTAFGFADGLLGPGANDAAEVLVMNPPAFATIEFEIAAKKATYIPARVEGLRALPGPIQPASFGSGFSATGKVVHGGTVPARFVHVRALALDSTGKVLGVDDTYADAEVLAPGASARFDLSMQPFSEKPARWEFHVDGMTVD